MRVIAWTGVLVAVAPMACNDTGANESQGIAQLGIARIEVKDSTRETIVRGYDASDKVVASLSLVHGRFALTGSFREEYDTAEVDGRKLDVDVRGKTLTWETAGYTPTLHMPAHPPSAWDVALFLEAPQVKMVLDRWQIGWEHRVSTEESPYTIGSFAGTSITGCDGQVSCGSARGLTINTCGGGAAAMTASRATMANPAASGTSQIKVAQCCPGGSGGMDVDWFATKTCALTGTVSECGSSTAACKGCGVYLAWSSCSVTRDATNVYYDYTATLNMPSNCGNPCGPISAEGMSCGTWCSGECRMGTCTLSPQGGE